MKPTLEQALQVSPDGPGRWRVRLVPAETVEDRQIVAVSEPLGVYAWVGTVAGRVEIEELVFTPPSEEGRPEWTEALVQSWLATQGFDRGRGALQERGFINADGKAHVRDEGDDWWVVTMNALTREGAFNGILRPADAFRRSWRLYDGVPVTHPHPPGLVENLDHVAGVVRNTQVKEEGGRLLVTADYWLAKRPLDGLSVSPANVEKNAETVRRVRANKRVDNSQGYAWVGRERGPQDPANEAVGGDYQWVMTEFVPNHLAILLDEEGACAWGAGCGVARLAAERLRADAAAAWARVRVGQKAQDRRGGDGHEDRDMACDGKCTGHQQLEQASAQVQQLKPKAERLEHLESGLKGVAKTLGLQEGATCEQVQATLKPRLERLQRFEEAEKKEVEDLAKECASVAIKLGLKEKKDKEALEQHYATEFGVVALREHAASLNVHLKQREARGGDPGRFGTEDASEAPKRRTVGFPEKGADGKTTWKA